MDKKGKGLADWLAEQPGRIKYDFTPDAPELLVRKGNVSFLIGLKGSLEGMNVDPNEIRGELNDILEGLGYPFRIGYGRYLNSSSCILCWTDQETYETVFQTTLEQSSIKAGTDGYTPEGYRHVDPAKVPSQLEDRVDTIALNLVRKA